MQIKHKSGRAAAMLAAMLIMSTPALAWHGGYNGWHGGYYHGANWSGGYYGHSYGYYNGVHRYYAGGTYYQGAPVVRVGVVSTGTRVWVSGHYYGGVWVPGRYVVG